MPPARPDRRRRILLVLAAAVLIPVGASILYNYSPLEGFSFYPRCMFHAMTGLNCPGCGATRSLYSLLHGDLEQAFSYNPLFILALPLLLFGVGQIIYTICTGKPAPGRRMPWWAVYAIFVVVIAYAIVRNLPVYPFFR